MRYSFTFMASTATLFTLAVSSPIATYGIPHHPPHYERAVTNAVISEAAVNADRVAINAVHAVNADKIAAINAIKPNKRHDSAINAEQAVNAEKVASINAVKATNAIKPTKREAAVINAEKAVNADRVAINAIKPNKREAEASVINAEKAVNADRVAINAIKPNKRWEEEAAINADRAASINAVKATNAIKPNKRSSGAINAKAVATQSLAQTNAERDAATNARPIKPNKRDVEWSA